MKSNYITLLLLCCFTVLGVFGQQTTSNPTVVITASEFRVVEPFNNEDLIPVDTTPREVNNKNWINYPTNFNALPKGKDPLLKESSKRAGTIATRSPLVNFDGAISGVHSGAVPPDPTGAAGPNHYIHAWNSGFAIFDKSGALLQPHASLANIWPGETTGDPIFMYDRYADRFVVTQFDGNPNALLVAVSQGPDPVNDGWFTYSFNTGLFPDYPHYGIWHDGYYVAVNKNPGAGQEQFYAMERDKLLAGDATAQLVGFIPPGNIENNAAVFAAMPMNSVGPTLPDASLPGYFTYLQDDAWAGGVDRLNIWEVELDWDNVGNSTISAPLTLNTTPFDSFVAPFGTGEVPQPGTTQPVDGITGVVSYSVDYYNFGGDNSALLNFNVDVNGDNTVLGIRWFELRENTGSWSIFQEGTFAPDDGLYRFMGSMGIDQNRNIGLAYSAGNADNFISLRYTGRFANSPLGEMVFAEQTIVQGAGSQDFSNRYGDYAHLTLDPSDNETFWFTSEYFASNNEWRTRIAAFKISPNGGNDVGVTAITAPNDNALTNSETVTIELINYGSDTQTDIPVWFQVDGGSMIMETVPGPLNSTETTTYTFTATADLGSGSPSYNITASTDLAGDIDTGNDAISKEVFNVFADDIGVTSINSPATAQGLTANEVVQVTVENFGGDPQSNFDVTYTVDGMNPITEQIAGPLNSGETVDYDFTTTVDVSNVGTAYEISATTSLPGDEDTSNDSVTTSVYNAGCIPAAASCGVDGIKRFVLNTIDIGDGSDGCNSTGAVQGYNDYTGLSTDLDREAGSNEYILQSQHNWAGGATVEQLSVWIDFDDNGVFDGTEQLIVAQNYTSANELNDFDLVIPTDANLGSHILRARGLDPTGNPGDPNDPCADMQFGETFDFTVNIVDGSLSVDDQALLDAEFNIYDRGDNNFELVLRTSNFTDELVVTMHNVLGQRLVRNRVNYENGQYTYNMTLDGLSAGVYLVRIGNNSFGRVKRIVVK